MARNYRWVHATLNQPQTSILAENCNVIIFRNTGTATVLINGDPLPVGYSLTLEGWNDELDLTNYTVQWTTATGGQVQYWRKFYN